MVLSETLQNMQFNYKLRNFKGKTCIYKVNCKYSHDTSNLFYWKHQLSFLFFFFTSSTSHWGNCYQHIWLQSYYFLECVFNRITEQDILVSNLGRHVRQDKTNKNTYPFTVWRRINGILCVYRYGMYIVLNLHNVEMLMYQYLCY
jgi:hypothetical protein